MNVTIDPDVKAVAEFMQTHIAADRLIRVAAGVAAIAPALWGDELIRLTPDPITVAAARTPIAASESRPAVDCAVGDSVAAVGCLR